MTWILVTLFALLVLAALVLALPWLLESRRHPMSDRLRADAPGEFMELSGGLTHYRWRGSRSDRVIVLVHGLSTPSWVFGGLIGGLLNAGYRVLTYDLYGRGFSDRPHEAQDIDSHVNQLSELVDGLGLNSFALMGYSMGGQIISEYAAREPDRVDRLVLLAPSGVGIATDRFLSFVRDGGLPGAWAWASWGGRYLMGLAKEDAQDECAIEHLEDRMADEIGRRGYLAAVRSSLCHTLTDDAETAHREIARMYIPTLAIWAENDSVIPITALGKLAQWNRGARQVVVPGAGHSLGYTRPAEVLDALREFLREIPD